MAINYSGVNRTHPALGANNSLQTGNPWFTGDFNRVTVSVTTGAAAASRITIVGSDLDGFASTLSSADPNNSNNTWNQLAAFTTNGIFSIVTVPRWMMAIRDTANSGQTASNITVIFTGIY